MRMAPGRGRSHLCWRPLIFTDEFSLPLSYPPWWLSGHCQTTRTTYRVSITSRTWLFWSQPSSTAIGRGADGVSAPSNGHSLGGVVVLTLVVKIQKKVQSLDDWTIIWIKIICQVFFDFGPNLKSQNIYNSLEIWWVVEMSNLAFNLGLWSLNRFVQHLEMEPFASIRVHSGEHNFQTSLFIVNFPKIQGPW